MKETLRLILILTAIATLTGALLALANRLTEEPIQAARRAELLKALDEVLPPYDNEPDREETTVTHADRVCVFYPARRDGVFAGAAAVVREEGYGGAITVMAGIEADGLIRAVRILNQLETPGLGANIVEPRFTGQFAGRAGGAAALRQDGGEIDAVTAATVSSRAVADAVALALTVFAAHRETLEAVEAETAPGQLKPDESSE